MKRNLPARAPTISPNVGQGQGEAQTPIDEFAADVLDRLIKKTRKKGRRLDELSPKERHKLRIKVKKIRYGLEFFWSLYTDKDREQLAKLGTRLKKIQDALGALNDAIAHAKIARQAALTAPRKNRRSRAFTSGVIVGQESGAAKGLIRAAEKEIRKVRPRHEGTITLGGPESGNA